MLRTTLALRTRLMQPEELRQRRLEMSALRHALKRPLVAVAREGGVAVSNVLLDVRSQRSPQLLPGVRQGQRVVAVDGSWRPAGFGTGARREPARERAVHRKTVELAPVMARALAAERVDHRRRTGLFPSRGNQRLRELCQFAARNRAERWQLPDGERAQPDRGEHERNNP